MSDELKKLLPGKMLTLSTNEQITISPIRFGKLMIYEEAVTRLITKLLENGMNLAEINDFRQIIRTAHEETIGVLMLILDKQRDWFDAIDIGDAFDIIDIVVEQNYNERVKKSGKKLMDLAKSAYAKLSKASSAQAIAGQIYADIQQSKSSSSPEPSAN
jgi:RNA binding exosome subunit